MWLMGGFLVLQSICMVLTYTIGNLELGTWKALQNSNLHEGGGTFGGHVRSINGHLFQWIRWIHWKVCEYFNEIYMDIKGLLVCMNIPVDYADDLFKYSWILYFNIYVKLIFYASSTPLYACNRIFMNIWLGSYWIQRIQWICKQK